jgi:hypothetical protein
MLEESGARWRGFSRTRSSFAREKNLRRVLCVFYAHLWPDDKILIVGSSFFF